MEKKKFGMNKLDLRWIVIEGLRAIGYGATVCKSRWEKSPYFLIDGCGATSFISVGVNMMEPNCPLLDTRGAPLATSFKTCLMGTRGYWDPVWNEPRGPGIFDVIKGTNFRIIVEDENQVEISFTRTWDPSLKGNLVPLNIDKRFIMLRGCSGFYTYAIYEHLEGWPDFSIGETRVAFKLRKDKFHYMAISDDRQRIMPMPDDRLPRRCQPLAYPEAVILTNPINPDLTDEVDDKYQYSSDNKDNKVHGWISSDPPIGFWQITPSDEFRTGGPLKQNLTSHVGPTTLAMFMSAHYAGDDLVPKFRDGEYWKKVFGPVLMYLNSSWDYTETQILWEDAKFQMQIEVDSWPYSFPVSEDFQKSEQRGSVSGRLLVRDSYAMKKKRRMILNEWSNGQNH